MSLFPILMVFLLGLPFQESSGPDEGASAQPDVSVPVVKFVQKVTGRPGSPDSETQIQRVILASDRVWLLDEQRRLIQILRGDLTPPVLWEVSADLGRYRELTDLSQIQKDRWVQEKQFIQRLDGLPASEREQLLKGAHIWLNDEGQSIRVVRVVEMEAAESEKESSKRRVQVFENDRLVADLWLADLQIPFSLAPLHEATGAFSSEVFEVIRDLKGFPVSGTIYVVTATLTHPLEFVIENIEKSSVSVNYFELPENCQKEEQRSFLNCPICGSEVERESSAARARDREGRWIFFDSRECFSEWKKQRKTRQR